MKKNKLLFIIQLPPPIHGASLVNQTLIDSSLLNNRYEIDIIQTQLASSMVDMGSFSFKKTVTAVGIYLKAIKKLLFNKYDLIYFTLSPLGFAFYKDAILVFIVKLLSNSKIVFHLHGKGIKTEAANSKFKKCIYKQVFKNTEVIQLAPVLKDDIKDVYDKTPYVLANGIPEVHSSINKTENATTFIYLSNLMQEKGILIFLESIRSLQEYKNQFKVLVVGPSADISIEEVNRFLKQNNIENIKVIGPVYGKEKYRYLDSSDVFVLPTYYKNECFPLSILEAFQAGLAVISTDNGAIPDMVENGVNGFVIKPQSTDELIGKMKFLIENRPVLTNIQTQNKIKYKNHYTEEIFIDNFIGIIDAILEK